MWDALVRLTAQHRREALPEAHLLAARALAGARAWREAERHYLEARDWAAAVEMHRCGQGRQGRPQGLAPARVHCLSGRTVRLLMPHACAAPLRAPKVPGRVGGCAARGQGLRRRARDQDCRVRVGGVHGRRAGGPAAAARGPGRRRGGGGGGGGRLWARVCAGAGGPAPPLPCLIAVRACAAPGGSTAHPVPACSAPASKSGSFDSVQQHPLNDWHHTQPPSRPRRRTRRATCTMRTPCSWRTAGASQRPRARSSPRVRRALRHKLCTAAHRTGLLCRRHAVLPLPTQAPPTPCHPSHPTQHTPHHTPICRAPREAARGGGHVHALPRLGGGAARGRGARAGRHRRRARGAGARAHAPCALPAVPCVCLAGALPARGRLGAPPHPARARARRRRRSPRAAS